MNLFHKAAAISLISITACFAAETWVGTYNWNDLPAEAYGDKTMSMSLEKTDTGYKATFTANFKTDQFGKAFVTAKDYNYHGTLSEDKETGFLNGKIYEPNNKRFWILDLKIKDDTAIGFAREISGYKTWGTITLKKQ